VAEHDEFSGALSSRVSGRFRQVLEAARAEQERHVRFGGALSSLAA
jgi:hypothetical protein